MEVNHDYVPYTRLADVPWLGGKPPRPPYGFKLETFTEEGASEVTHYRFVPECGRTTRFPEALTDG